MAPPALQISGFHSKLQDHAAQLAKLTARSSGELVVKFDSKRKLPNFQLNTPDPGPPGPPSEPPPAPPLPTQIGPFQSGYIGFSDPIPVGGNMSLALFENGSYSFAGHFHDSGAPSYDVEAVWIIVSESGKAFSFAVKGSTHGTFEAGSRNFDFTQNGNNSQLQDAWPDLCAGYHWRYSVYVNWNVQSAVDDVVSALKTAGTVIGTVVAVVALL